MEEEELDCPSSVGPRIPLCLEDTLAHVQQGLVHLI